MLSGGLVLVAASNIGIILSERKFRKAEGIYIDATQGLRNQAAHALEWVTPRRIFDSGKF